MTISVDTNKNKNNNGDIQWSNIALTGIGSAFTKI